MGKIDNGYDGGYLVDMDLAERVLREHSCRHSEQIADWVGQDPKRFRQLMGLFLQGEYRVAQLAAMVFDICADRHPDLVRPYLSKMLRRMKQPGIHDAVRRAVVRHLQCADIPPELLGTTTTVCFEYLANVETPIAIRAFSMTVLARVALVEPDLANELRLVIEQQLPYGSAGFKARARRVLKTLDRIQSTSSVQANVPVGQ